MMMIMACVSSLGLLLDESSRGIGAQPEAPENTLFPVRFCSRLSDLAVCTSLADIGHNSSGDSCHWHESQGPPL